MASYCEVCRGLFDLPHPHTGAPSASTRHAYGLLPVSDRFQCEGDTGDGRANTRHRSPWLGRTPSPAHPRHAAEDPGDRRQSRSSGSSGYVCPCHLGKEGCDGHGDAPSASHALREGRQRRRTASLPGRVKGDKEARSTDRKGGRERSVEAYEEPQTPEKSHVPRYKQDTFNSTQRAASARPLRLCPTAFRDPLPISELPPPSHPPRLLPHDDNEQPGEAEYGASSSAQLDRARARRRHSRRPDHRASSAPPAPSSSYTSAPSSNAKPQRASAHAHQTNEPEPAASASTQHVFSKDTLQSILDRMRHAVREQRRLEQQQLSMEAATSVETDDSAPAPTEEMSESPTYIGAQTSAFLRQYPRESLAQEGKANRTASSPPELPRPSYRSERVGDGLTTSDDGTPTATTLTDTVASSERGSSSASQGHEKVPRGRDNERWSASSGLPGAGRGIARWYRQLSLTQQAAMDAQNAKLEELRRGFVQLCSAVRDDLHAVEDRLDGKIHSETSRLFAQQSHLHSGIGAAGRSPASQDAAGTSSSSGATSSAATSDAVVQQGKQPSLDMQGLIRLVRGATHSEKAALAEALRPALQDVTDERVREALREHSARQREWLLRQTDGLQRELDASSAQLRQEHRALAHELRNVASTAAKNSPSAAHSAILSADSFFSSPEAFEAHVRAITRSTLLEEDEHRYHTAEAQHQRSMQHAQRERDAARHLVEEHQRHLVAQTEQRLGAMAAAVRKEWREALENESRRLERSHVAPLEGQLRVVANTVQALSQDMETLSRQQDTLRDVVSANMTSAATSRAGGGGSKMPPPSSATAQTAAVALSREQLATADGIRQEVVQPALEHMRRLLAAHQKMLDTVVEQRCQRAEAAAQENRHVWEQNVVELRSKMHSLRLDVRGAFAELCQNLNVAAPGL